MLTALTNAQLQEYALIAGAIGAGIALLAFVILIAYPAWSSYGRTWERFSALFLSFYVLIAMLGVGSLIGFGIFLLVGNDI